MPQPTTTTNHGHSAIGDAAGYQPSVAPIVLLLLAAATLLLALDSQLGRHSRPGPWRDTPPARTCATMFKGWPTGFPPVRPLPAFESTNCLA